MNHPQHQKHLEHLDFMANFPRNLYPDIRQNQQDALEIIARQGSCILELPVGSGKTGIGYTVLKTLEKAGQGPLFYIVHNKTLVDQVKQLHPDVKVVYGRNEYPCLYFQEQNLTAEEVACSILTDCPHRVDQETGLTKVAGVAPCPYYQQKYEAKQGGIIACTFAFYLVTQLFSKEWDEPAGLIIDEAHRIARVVRDTLSYEISDYSLRRAVWILSDIDEPTALNLNRFLKNMIRIIKMKPAYKSTLLETHEIRELMEDLLNIDTISLKRKIKEAISSGKIESKDLAETLKTLEHVVYDLGKYLRSLEYSLETPSHKPLNYTYAFFKEELTGNEKVQYRLFIKSYYVAPIIQKILSRFTVAYSATIGDPEVFGFETGIKLPFYTFPSHFPTKNAKVYLPFDTPNLAVKERSNREPTKVLRRIVRACKEFNEAGLRCLMVVISDKERQKFLMLCNEEEVHAISYGNGINPREAATKFKKGEGGVLVGTGANYGEGLDLPQGIAPVIFYLRPGYPNPTDPATIFEERRWGGMRWKLWNWRVMIEALQVRGRNIRSAEDLGVTFFVSQQFGRFLYAILPEWLKEAYDSKLSFEKGVEEVKKILKS